MVWHAYAIGAGITARCWHSRFFPHQTCPPIDTSMWLLWPSRGPIDTTQNTCHCDNMRTFLQRLTDCDRVIAIMIRIAFLNEKFQPKKIGDLMQSCSNCLRLFQVNPDPNLWPLCYWSWNYCPLLALPPLLASDLPSNWYIYSTSLKQNWTIRAVAYCSWSWFFSEWTTLQYLST